MIKYKLLNLALKIQYQIIKLVFQKESSLLLNRSPQGWSFSNPGLHREWPPPGSPPVLPPFAPPAPFLGFGVCPHLTFTPPQLGRRPHLSRGKDPWPCSLCCPRTPQPSLAGLWLMWQFRGIWAICEALRAHLFFVIESLWADCHCGRQKSNPTKPLNLVCRCHEKLPKPLILKMLL